MADAPGKNDIDQIFKRLRSAAANKVKFNWLYILYIKVYFSQQLESKLFYSES